MWGRRGEPACLDAGQHGISDAKCVFVYISDGLSCLRIRYYYVLDIIRYTLHTLLEKIENTH